MGQQSRLSNFLTAALALATVWLAYDTHHMATATKDIVALEARPYFVFKDLSFRFFVPKEEAEKASADVKVGLVFSNPGRVPVQYKMKTIRVTVSGSTIDNPRFANIGSHVYPSDQTTFWYGVIPFAGKLSPPITGIVEFQVEYNEVGGDVPHLMGRKLEYTVNSLEPFSVDWIYLEEHSD